jgi:hypothetical protein
MNDTDLNTVEQTIRQAHEAFFNRTTPLGKRPIGGEAGFNYNAWHGSDDVRQDLRPGNPTLGNDNPCKLPFNDSEDNNDTVADKQYLGN